MTVFREVYEVVGAAKKRAETFHAARNAALKAQWTIVESFGATGFRPGYNGTIKTLMFPGALPKGFRKVGLDAGRIEAAPSRNTKLGVAHAASLASAPVIETWRTFANMFDWKGRCPMDFEGGRGVIYHCAGVRVEKPRVRIFLTYPRTLDDKWSPPAGLKLVRESDMLRAIEDHNSAIKTRSNSRKGIPPRRRSRQQITG